MIFLYDFPPPAIYDHACANCSTIEKPLEQMRSTCEAVGVHLHYGLLFGCSWKGPSGCTIIIPEISPYITKEDQAQVKRIEQANCNGWPKGNRE